MNIGVLLEVGACVQRGQPAAIVDTSGSPFAWSCGNQCWPEPVAGTPALPPCATGTALYAWGLDRFIEISAACTTPDGGWSSADNLSRPVACATSADCPLFGGTAHTYECRHGLCQNADTEMYPPDRIDRNMADTLCYAPFVRADTLDPVGPAAVEVSDWVMAACPSMSAPCSLPLPGTCAQPL